MKKACCVGICLLIAGNVVSSDWAWDAVPEERMASYKEYFANPEKIKEFLAHEFISHSPIALEDRPRFKRKFDMQDEIIRPILLDIFNESAQKTGWKAITSQRDATEEAYESETKLIRVIGWLGAFADAPVKKPAGYCYGQRKGYALPQAGRCGLPAMR